MALPAIVNADADISRNNNVGPWVASDGDLFVVMGDVNIAIGDPGTLEVYRSTDGGNTWGSGVSWGTVSVNPASSLLIYDTFQDGDTIHVVGYEDDGGTTPFDIAIRYRAFDMATNAWTGSIDTVFSATVDIRVWQVSIVKRTSDVVILHQGTDNSGISAVAYSRGSAGSWSSTDNDVFVGTSGLEPVGNSVYGSIIGSQADEVHFFGVETATNPPFHDRTTLARTLRSDNSLSTISSLAHPWITTDTGTHQMATWDDSGTQRISWYELIDYRVSVEDGSDDISIAGSPGEDPPDINHSNESAIYFDGDLYFIFRGNTGSDFHFDKAVAGAGTAWGTDTFMWNGDPLGPFEMATNIFVHSAGNGGKTVIGVVYMSDAVPFEFSYNEYVLVGDAHTGTPTDDVDVTDDVIDDLVEPVLETVVSPVSDVVSAGWDSAPSPSQPLWDQLDEVTPSDTDYIFPEVP